MKQVIVASLCMMAANGVQAAAVDSSAEVQVTHWGTPTSRDIFKGLKVPVIDLGRGTVGHDWLKVLRTQDGLFETSCTLITDYNDDEIDLFCVVRQSKNGKPLSVIKR